MRAWARGRGRRWALGRADGRGAQALGRAGRTWQTGGRRAGAGKRANTGGRAGGSGARCRRTLSRRAGRGGRRGRARRTRGRAGWALGARPGRAGWPWVVHSVHSACFWPGSTRYFPELKFFDIVREPGS